MTLVFDLVKKVKRWLFVIEDIDNFKLVFEVWHHVCEEFLNKIDNLMLVTFTDGKMTLISWVRNLFNIRDAKNLVVFRIFFSLQLHNFIFESEELNEQIKQRFFLFWDVQANIKLRVFLVSWAIWIWIRSSAFVKCGPGPPLKQIQSYHLIGL